MRFCDCIGCEKGSEISFIVKDKVRYLLTIQLCRDHYEEIKKQIFSKI